MSSRSRRSCVKSSYLRHKGLDGRFSRSRMKKTEWTKVEDEKLYRLVKEFGSNGWASVSLHFNGQRSEGDCQKRWHQIKGLVLVKGPWTQEEDEQVIQLVQKYGSKHWSLIASHILTRNGKQCRERWHNHLNPEVKKSSWTLEEDRIIYQAHSMVGNRWTDISKLLPGRTENSIKNRWNSTLRRKVENESHMQVLDLHDASSTFTPAPRRCRPKAESSRASAQQRRRPSHAHLGPFCVPTSCSGWSSSPCMCVLMAAVEPTELFSLCGAEDVTLQQLALTSTPLCSLQHSSCTTQDCLHCSLSKQCVGRSSAEVRGDQSRTPASSVSSSQKEIQGESLLRSSLQVQLESSSIQQQDQDSSLTSKIQTKSRSTLDFDDLGCFPLDGQVDVWWCPQPAGFLDSPQCSVYTLDLSETSLLL